MAMTNAERCRRYRRSRWERDTIRDMVRDMLPFIIQEVAKELRHGYRHDSDMIERSPDKKTPPDPPKELTPKDSPPLSPLGTSPPLGETEKDTLLHAKRGSRLPLDWQPCEADRQFAAAAGIELDREADRFRDYWHAKSGAAATKLDWCATWRNWCRKAAEDRSGSGRARRRSPVENLYLGAMWAADAYDARHRANGDATAEPFLDGG